MVSQMSNKINAEIKISFKNLPTIFNPQNYFSKLMIKINSDSRLSNNINIRTLRIQKSLKVIILIN